MNAGWSFTEDEKNSITSLLAKGAAEQARNDRFAVIDVDSFYRLLTEDEVAAVERYLAIDPEKVGFTAPFLGLEDTPADIVPVPPQHYVTPERTVAIPRQYLPAPTYEAYVRLNSALTDELGRGVGVLYGYRSPARQVYMFFDILVNEYDFDFDRAIRHVCFPAYSEHVFSRRQAIDFITEDGVCTTFDTTAEYLWLQRNAEHFGFVESYPQGNPWDMRYEPWHWRHQR